MTLSNYMNKINTELLVVMKHAKKYLFHQLAVIFLSVLNNIERIKALESVC